MLTDLVTGIFILVSGVLGYRKGLAGALLSLAGLVTHTIAPEQLGDAYEGLLKKKEEYLGVLVKWV